MRSFRTTRGATRSVAVQGPNGKSSMTKGSLFVQVTIAVAAAILVLPSSASDPATGPGPSPTTQAPPTSGCLAGVKAGCVCPAGTFISRQTMTCVSLSTVLTEQNIQSTSTFSLLVLRLHLFNHMDVARIPEVVLYNGSTTLAAAKIQEASTTSAALLMLVGKANAAPFAAAPLATASSAVKATYQSLSFDQKLLSQVLDITHNSNSNRDTLVLKDTTGHYGVEYRYWDDDASCYTGNSAQETCTWRHTVNVSYAATQQLEVVLHYQQSTTSPRTFFLPFRLNRTIIHPPRAKICGHCTCRDLVLISCKLVSFLPLLNIDYEGITAIKGSPFQNLTFIKRLDAQHNKLVTLPAHLFSTLVALEVVELNNNRLSSLPEQIFSNNVNLREVNLTNNRLTGLSARIFANNINLRSVDLHQNQLQSLSHDFLKNNVNLTFFNAGQNTLRTLPRDFFRTTRNLATLALDGGQIEYLQQTIFSPLPADATINVTGNPVLLTSNRACGMFPRFNSSLNYDYALSQKCSNGYQCFDKSYSCSCPSGQYFDGTSCQPATCTAEPITTSTCDVFPQCTVDTTIDSGNYGTTKKCSCPANSVLVPHPCPYKDQRDQFSPLEQAASHCGQYVREGICVCPGTNLTNYCRDLPSSPLLHLYTERCESVRQQCCGEALCLDTNNGTTTYAKLSYDLHCGPNPNCKETRTAVCSYNFRSGQCVRQREQRLPNPLYVTSTQKPSTTGGEYDETECDPQYVYNGRCVLCDSGQVISRQTFTCVDLGMALTEEGIPNGYLFSLIAFRLVTRNGNTEVVQAPTVVMYEKYTMLANLGVSPMWVNNSKNSATVVLVGRVGKSLFSGEPIATVSSAINLNYSSLGVNRTLFCMIEDISHNHARRTSTLALKNTSYGYAYRTFDESCQKNPPQTAGSNPFSNCNWTDASSSGVPYGWNETIEIAMYRTLPSSNLSPMLGSSPSRHFYLPFIIQKTRVRIYQPVKAQSYFVYRFDNDTCTRVGSPTGCCGPWVCANASTAVLNAIKYARHARCSYPDTKCPEETTTCALNTATQQCVDVYADANDLPRNSTAAAIYSPVACADCACQGSILVLCTYYSQRRSMSLEDRGLTGVSGPAFPNFTFRKLNLRQNKLVTLPANIFDTNVQMEVLDLSENLLTGLPAMIFVNNAKLLEVHLQSNRIQSLPRTIFQHYQFRKIDLRQNQLTTLHPDLLQETIHLTFFDVSHNLLRTLPRKIFRASKDLAILHLEHNRLEYLPDSVFTGLPLNGYLNLNHNPVLAGKPNRACGIKPRFSLNPSSNGSFLYDRALSQKCTGGYQCFDKSYSCSCPSGQYFDGTSCQPATCTAEPITTSTCDVFPVCSVDTTIEAGNYGTTKKCSCPANSVLVPHPCPYKDQLDQFSPLQQAASHCGQSFHEGICVCPGTDLTNYCRDLPSSPVLPHYNGRCESVRQQCCGEAMCLDKNNDTTAYAKMSYYVHCGPNPNCKEIRTAVCSYNFRSGQCARQREQRLPNPLYEVTTRIIATIPPTTRTVRNPTTVAATTKADPTTIPSTTASSTSTVPHTTRPSSPPKSRPTVPPTTRATVPPTTTHRGAAGTTTIPQTTRTTTQATNQTTTEATTQAGSHAPGTTPLAHEPQAKTCPQPPHISGGGRTVSSFQVGGSVMYSCLPGYKFTGTSEFLCSPAGTWDIRLLPNCTPNPSGEDDFSSSSSKTLTTAAAVLGFLVVALVIGIVLHIAYPDKFHLPQVFGRSQKWTVTLVSANTSENSHTTMIKRNQLRSSSTTTIMPLTDVMSTESEDKLVAERGWHVETVNKQTNCVDYGESHEKNGGQEETVDNIYDPPPPLSSVQYLSIANRRSSKEPLSIWEEDQSWNIGKDEGYVVAGPPHNHVNHTKVPSSVAKDRCNSGNGTGFSAGTHPERCDTEIAHLRDVDQPALHSSAR